MKIAQCLEYPLELRGGVSVVVESLASELARQGHTIVLVSPDTPEAAEAYKKQNSIAQHIHWDPGKSSVKNAKKLAQQLEAAGIDLAHFHAGGTYGWNNRLPFRSPVYHLHKKRIPIFWTSHRAESILDGFCGPQKPLLFKLVFFPIAWLGKLQQLSCSLAEIAVSQENLLKLRRWHAPFRSRFVQIYHSRLHSTPIISEPTARKHEVLSVGHFAVAKGQIILVKAFARVAERHRNFTLLLAGHEGTDGTAQQVRAVIRENALENRIVLLGERSDAQELMRRAEIYVQPSLNEALGLALQEAMFNGCAVIGSRTGGIPELIQHERNGLLFEPGNIGELANLLEKLMNDPACIKKFSQAATKSILDREMTIEKMTERHLELYKASCPR